MLVALLLSLSRSGVLALGLSAAITCRGRAVIASSPVIDGSCCTATLAVLLVGLVWADVPALRVARQARRPRWPIA